MMDNNRRQRAEDGERKGGCLEGWMVGRLAGTKEKKEAEKGGFSWLRIQ